MGLFWDLYQQSRLSEHDRQVGTLESRVARLEAELERTQSVVHQLIQRLEESVGKDLDGDGRVG